MVKGVSGSNYARVSKLMAEIGKSIDPGSSAGVRVSDGEAKKILGELNKLPSAERTEVTRELQDLMQRDIFSVTGDARALFAKEMGVEVKNLDPRAHAELVGGAEEKSRFQMTVQRLAKPASMSKAEMRSFLGKLQDFAPPEMQAQMAVTMQNAQKDGLISLEPDARREFVKFYGKQDVAEAAKDIGQLYNSPADKKMDYISKMMASGACFEDIVAAFMGAIVSKMQEEQLEKMKEMEGNDQITRTRERLTKKLHKSAETGGVVALDETDKNQLGVLAKYGVGPRQGVPGGNNKPVTKPNVGDEPNIGKPKGDGTLGGDLAQTKEQLTNLVSSVHGHLSDIEADGSTGIINQHEARSIVRHLENLPEGVDTLVAQSLCNTLKHTDGLGSKLDDPKGALSPIADWLKEKLGSDIDLTPDPAYKPGSGMTSDIAKKLFFEGDKKKPRLENKLAAFLVDSLLVSEKNLGAKLEDLKGFTGELTKTPAAKEAFEKVVGEPPAEVDLDGAMKAREGNPTFEVPQDAVQLGAEVGVSLEDNVKNGLADVAKSGKPMTLWFNNEDITIKPGDNLEGVMKGLEARGLKGDTLAEFSPNVMTADQIQDALKKLPEAKSREMMFEELKNINNLLQQVMQALGNVLNSMHQTAMNSIRSIR